MNRHYVPLRISLMNVYGLREAMEAMRLPRQSKSDTTSEALGPRDARLAAALIAAGDEHAKALRGIVAYVKVRMQVGWMIQFETYRHGVECLSTSSSMHGELRHLSGRELAERKQQDLPTKVYTRILTISYQALRRMYLQRRGHRHPDWQIFCDFVETLPYFRQLIAPDLAD